MEALALKQTTVDEFKKMDFDDPNSIYYELIDGEINMKGAQLIQHQNIQSELGFVIKSYVKDHKLGKIFYAPVYVVLDEFQAPQPDLIYVSNKNLAIIEEDAIRGIPDLVIEIISPSSVYRDRIEKKRIYETAGIKEYWLIDPQYQEIEIYVLENNCYELFSAAVIEEGELKSSVLEGLKIDLKEIFN